MLILNIVTKDHGIFVNSSEINKVDIAGPIKHLSIIKQQGSKKREIARYNNSQATGIVFQIKRTDSPFSKEELLGIGLLSGDTVTIKWYDNDGINIESERRPASSFIDIIPTIPVTTSTQLKR